jgi:glycolate oxidase
MVRALMLLDELRTIVGPDAILSSASDLLVYECDGFTIEKNKPDLVMFPTSTEQG